MKQINRYFVFVLTILFVSVSVASPQSEKKCSSPIAATDAKFSPGQVWTFKSRSFESNPTITILKIEASPKLGVIIHVRIDGIRLRHCGGGPELDNIAHAPFTRDAIDRSALKLLRTGDVPSYEEGYKIWLDHCGGVYTISLAEMVAVDEKTFNSRSGCSL